MIHKIQRKLKKTIYSLDIFKYENNVLRIKGWMFSKDSVLEDVTLVLKGKKQAWTVMAETQVERIDVYNHFNKNKYALRSGFYAVILVKGLEKGTVWLEYTKDGKRDNLYLGTLRGKKDKQIAVKPHAETIEYLNLSEFEKNNLCVYQPFDYDDTVIDVIIPIYNGYEYLDTLFASVRKTKMKYRLILVHDCSPDKRVKEYLEEYMKNYPDTILLENEKNLGFVKSVNRGLEYSTNHVALVNTDVEVPDMWLERLMAPILKEDSMVASTTPYTNAGTICSFPELGEDQALYLGLDLETIDHEFMKIKPRYTEMPTGVGFCMGMNRKALDVVGLLDAENFGKGYCEENDWCQRAVTHNMVNVQVENLYVYHKHGGSFLSEDKIRYIEENSKKLKQKHPLYYQETAYFFDVDPNKDIRKYVQWKLMLKHQQAMTIVFNHNLGGGATSYLERKEQEIINSGEMFCLVRCNYDIGRTEIICKYRECCVKFMAHNLKEVVTIIESLKPNKIIVNEFVSYPQLYDILHFLSDYRMSHEVKLVFLVHDFYLVCPTVNLLNVHGEYCGVPCIESCEKCVKDNSELKYLEFSSVQEWRQEWNAFIQNCDEVIAFSEDSKNIVEKAYGKLGNMRVIPHEIDYLPVIKKQYKHTKTLNIGLLGTLVKHKGAEIVKRTVKYIEDYNLDINIVLIGQSGINIKSKHFKETGWYSRDMIPRLIFKNDIDVFWIASIWPETFSYTTEEIMTMQFPIMSFDLGAPAERIKRYEKGAISSSMNPEEIVSTAQKLYEENKVPYMCRKILFVVEEVTFSSRYRVEHLREQLLYQGVTSECMTIKEALKEKISEYECVVVYRSSVPRQIRHLVSIAHKSAKKVYYDIDDFLFDYDKISELGFWKLETYQNFPAYCNNIRQAMLQCDGYLTSTNALAEQITRSMKTDKVYINRNVASAEMAIISLFEKNHVKKDKDKIILGYFSGTKTHDKDFELIKYVLLKMLEKHSNVYLKIGGQINLPKEFNMFTKRVETFEFVSWKQLPKLIASVDVNLMPLENGLFHECKSENKWQEAALVGVPTIASFNSELALAFSDGKEGYLCKDCKEWEEKLEKMVVDAKLRNELADNAHKKVMREYITYTRDISDIIERLCENSK